jgi:IclR family transcriptional regulator, acetate operon repressor
MRDTLSTPLRSLGLLEAIIADCGASSVAAIARQQAVPVAAAHRHVKALVKAGYLVPAGYGRHVAGPRLRALCRLVGDNRHLVRIAAPVLDEIAAQTNCVVQLGTLDDGMVTYQLKTGRGSSELFTQVGMQLEAYCSAIGKVLLAYLPGDERENYLANGPFVALTDRTITDPDALRHELALVRTRGFAEDNEEIALGLCCLAVPLITQEGTIRASISASRNIEGASQEHPDAILTRLRSAASEICAQLDLEDRSSGLLQTNK